MGRVPGATIGQQVLGCSGGFTFSGWCCPERGGVLPPPQGWCSPPSTRAVLIRAGGGATAPCWASPPSHSFRVRGALSPTPHSTGDQEGPWRTGGWTPAVGSCVRPWPCCRPRCPSPSGPVLSNQSRFCRPRVTDTPPERQPLVPPAPPPRAAGSPSFSLLPRIRAPAPPCESGMMSLPEGGGGVGTTPAASPPAGPPAACSR